MPATEKEIKVRKILFLAAIVAVNKRDVKKIGGYVS